MHKLTAKDKAKLKGVHPDLVRVVYRAAEITEVPFRVIEGLRTLEQQKKNIANGVSWTLRSRHLDGHAVDIVPLVDGQVSWSWPVYHKFAPFVKKAAKDVGVPIEWGGDWWRRKDGPHWQLPWKQYPSAMKVAGPKASVMTEKQVATVAAGVTGSGFTAPIESIVYTLTGQQEELSSGDWTRMAIAGVIIALTIGGIAYSYWQSRN